MSMLKLCVSMASKINRRNFVKYASLASLGAGAAGCLGQQSGESGQSNATGGDKGRTQDGSQGSLKNGKRPVEWIGASYTNYDEQVKKFSNLHDIKLNPTRNALSKVQQKVLSGGAKTYDAVSVDTANSGALTIENNATAPVPTETLDRWEEKNISELFTNPAERLSQIGAQTKTVNNQLWENDAQTKLKFPPTVYNFDAIGYNPKFVKPGSISKWSSLFDDQFSGKVLFDAVPSIGIPETLMHMLDNDMIDGKIGQVNDPTKDQMDAAINFLTKQKKSGQFRSTWTAYGTSVNLMTSEDAILGDIWQPAALSVRRSGTPCKYATMSKDLQGYRYWWAGIMPTNPGAKDRNNMDEVRELIDFHLGAWFPGFIQEYGYSVPQYPNEELVRTGSDKTGQGMGPEYYDWAYRGKRTYEPVENPYLFDPRSYDWSMEEGKPNPDGQKRDSGPIDERIDRSTFFQIWPSNAGYMLERWKEFTSA